MAPTRPSPSSSAVRPSGRQKIFGDGTQHTTRIEKRSVPVNKRTKKHRLEKDSGPREPELAVTQSSRRPERGSLRSDRCLRSTRSTRNSATRATKRDTFMSDVQDESGEAEPRHTTRETGYHTIQTEGPKLKNIAELLQETDVHRHFRIHADKIIASEDIDTSVREQMRRFARGGNLTPDHVRKNLVDSIELFEECWHIRDEKSRPRFWKSACRNGGWMSRLDGADCREFFLWLCTYFRRAPGIEGANKMIRAFERLVELFRQEDDCELDELEGVQARLQESTSQSSGPRGAASKKKNSKTVPEDGNIFRLSGNTNMSDFELSGVDVKGLTAVVDVGDRRRQDEEWKRQFDDYAAVMAAKEKAEERQEAAAAQEAGPLMPDVKLEKPAETSREPSELREEQREDDAEKEERLRAAALKRQKLLKKHAARGGPKSD